MVEPISSTLKLPLFPVAAMKSPEQSGILTPPLHTLASVPFRWEEEPGKPRPCADLITLPNSIFNEPKCLEPPPRLLYLEFTKTPSPTTVLDGPYIKPDSTNKLSSSSSFRFLKGRVEKVQQVKSLVVYKNKVRKGGSWWQRHVKRKGASGNSVDSTEYCGSNDQGVKMARLRRSGSFSTLSQSRSHIWAAIYQGFKQVIPWRTKKSKKEVLNV